jgi:hypothetical protein
MRSLSRDLFGAVSREEIEMDFIERIFRVAPDNGTGTLEFLIVAALLILLLEYSRAGEKCGKTTTRLYPRLSLLHTHPTA